MKYLLFVMVILFTACQREPVVPTLPPSSSQDSVSLPQLTDSIGILIDDRHQDDIQYYKVINKCGKIWFAENLRFRLPNAFVDTMITTYNGRYYNVSEFNAICPAGWHVATDQDWKDLETCIGMSQSLVDNFRWRSNLAPVLKSGSLWNFRNGNNSSGMNIYPAGYIYRNSSIQYENELAVYMTKDVYDSTQPNDRITRVLSFQHDSIGRNDAPILRNTPCRCVKD